MNPIQKIIEDALGEYNEEVDKVIWAQIQKIIKNTGKFEADKWVLEVISPYIMEGNDKLRESNFIFSINGAVRLVPKPQAPREIKDSILTGAQIRQYTMESLPGYTNIIIKGYQDVDMVLNGSLRFNFELEIRSTDTRLGTVIEESLGY